MYVNSKASTVFYEEIVLKYVRDAKKQLRIDSWALEYFIDVRAVAIKLAGKPTDSSLLAFQFLLDKIADMDAGIHSIVRFSHKIWYRTATPLSALYLM